MTNKQENNISAISILVIMIGIVILINIIGISAFFRLDLTSDDLYSLSESSQEYLEELSDPVNIKVFFTENLPAPYNSNERYLRDILEEYAVYGGRNFNYEFIDPKENKDIARRYGIPEVQIRDIKADEVGFKMAMMGLVIIHGEWTEKIPIIKSTDGLEYKITSMIRKLKQKVESFDTISEEGIKVKIFFSANLPPSVDSAKSGIETALDELKEKIHGRLTYTYYDPLSDPESKAEADKYNLPPVAWSGFSRRGFVRHEGYMGMVFIYGDKVEVLESLPESDPADFIQSAVENLININKRIGYVTGHGEKSLYEEAAKYQQLISGSYKIVPVDLKKEIPTDIDTLIIAGPTKKFTDYELFMLDQFIMKGRSVAFFMRNIEANLQSSRQQMPTGRKTESNLRDFLKNYGVNVRDDLVCDDECGMISMSSGQGGIFGMMMQKTVKYHLLPILKGDKSISEDSIITEKLPFITVPFSSSLILDKKIIEDNKLEAEILLKTSKKGWLMKDRFMLHPSFITPPAEEEKFGIYNLAAQVEGEFKSYFVGKEVPEPEDEDAKEKKDKIGAVDRIIEKGKRTKIIVVGTSDIIDENAIG
ncbi:MAG: Gldg family protein, partial [Actinomycetia bacterium]|nr:Gldg family protein [Actinomycetes bacterium]